MKDALKRICELQPHYSPANTPEMLERGVLIRGAVQSAFEDLEHVLGSALGRFGADLEFGSSDGKGRKTELPWVRFCSKGMSPRPTEGFYAVMHFSTDGSAVHVTVGCGSSKYKNGSFVRLPDSELVQQTSWARAILEEQGGLSPFVDEPDFGATRPLPVSFQRATAISKRIPRHDIDSTDFEALLIGAAAKLKLIYEAQSIGRDLSPADQAVLEVESTLNPGHHTGTRQGFGLPSAAKRVVEQHAMVLAGQWLISKGYSISDCSATQPYDLEARDASGVLKIEVKGTTSDVVDAILMTSNEVLLHRAERGATGLIIVSRIRLSATAGNYTAHGGVVEDLLRWDIGEWELVPTAFRVARRTL